MLAPLAPTLTALRQPGESVWSPVLAQRIKSQILLPLIVHGRHFSTAPAPPPPLSPADAAEMQRAGSIPHLVGATTVNRIIGNRVPLPPRTLAPPPPPVRAADGVVLTLPSALSVPGAADDADELLECGRVRAQPAPDSGSDDDMASSDGDDDNMASSDGDDSDNDMRFSASTSLITARMAAASTSAAAARRTTAIIGSGASATPVARPVTPTAKPAAAPRPRPRPKPASAPAAPPSPRATPVPAPVSPPPVAAPVPVPVVPVPAAAAPAPAPALPAATPAAPKRVRSRKPAASTLRQTTLPTRPPPAAPKLSTAELDAELDAAIAAGSDDDAPPAPAPAPAPASASAPTPAPKRSRSHSRKPAAKRVAHEADEPAAPIAQLAVPRPEADDAMRQLLQCVYGASLTPPAVDFNRLVASVGAAAIAHMVARMSRKSRLALLVKGLCKGRLEFHRVKSGGSASGARCALTRVPLTAGVGVRLCCSDGAMCVSPAAYRLICGIDDLLRPAEALLRAYRPLPADGADGYASAAAWLVDAYAEHANSAY